MTRPPYKAFIRRGAETDEIFLEDLRGQVWNSFRDAGKTWKELAIAARVTNNTISKFAYGETRRPVFRTVYNISEALSIRISYDPPTVRKVTK